MNRKKVKHLQSLAWMLVASLMMTSVTPAVTAFAAQEQEQVSLESKGDDTSASFGSDKHNGETGSGSAASADHSGSAEKGDPDKESTSGDNNQNIDESGDKDHDADHSTDFDDKAEDGRTDDESEDASSDETSDGEAEDVKADEAAKDDDSEPEAGDYESEDEASEDGSTTEEDIDDAASDEVTADESSDDMTADEEVNENEEKENEEPEVEEDELIGEEPEEEPEEEAEEEIEPELLTASPSDIEYVCEIDENGYKSISAALSEVKDGDTITLLKDLKENAIIKCKELTLDLGGFTLSGRVEVKEGADVTLKNGKVYAGNSFSTVYASGNDDDPTRLTVADDALVTADGYGLVICGVTGSKDQNGTGYEVVINGSVKGIDDDSAGIFLQGNMRNTSAKVCDLIVNGIVEGSNYDGVALAINGWGNVTVNEGAKVSATTAIEIRAGSLTIEGGTVTGTGKQFADMPNTSGTTASGAGIMINEHTTDLPITVDINGGEISGTYALVQDNTQNNKNYIRAAITGGDFYSVKGNPSVRLFSPKDVSLLIYCGRFSNDTLLGDYLADGASLEYDGGLAVVHTYDVIGNIASCTEGGEGIYTCEYCGESKSGVSVGALGHVWGEWKVSKEPTATEDGLAVRTCNRCGETESKAIPAAGEEDMPEDDKPEEDKPEAKPEDKPEDTEKPDESSKPSSGNKPSSGRPASSGSHSKGDSGSSSASDNSSAAAADSTQHVISGLNPEGFSGQDSVLSTEPGLKAAPADVTFIDPVTGSTMSGNAPVYTDAGGRSGSFALGGTTFTKPDGTHPVNEYLKIGGQIYAFDASGVAVPFDNMDYYSPAIIASLSDLPEEEGNWDVLGMMFVYSDGTYPVNSWSELAIDGVSQSYYFGPDGIAATGWTVIDGIWHYFNSNGTLMREGITPDGLKVDVNGQLTM